MKHFRIRDAHRRRSAFGTIHYLISLNEVMFSVLKAESGLEIHFAKSCYIFIVLITIIN
jgi:hypothetical protein